MANKFIDSTLLDKAIMMAVKAHSNTERRGKGFPYIVHPMEAMEIVSTITADQEILAATALHDVVEDTDMTLEDVRREFGDRVASLVASESETPVEGKSESESWRERKQAAISRLCNASHDAKIVALGDKLSNMRAIYRDYQELGDKLWDRFHAPGGKSDHEWHYRGLTNAFLALAGTFAFNEFTQLVSKVFGEPKPELIDMSEWEESGDGFTAISYNHKDGQRMMKLYADFIPEHVPLHELKTTWHIRQMGLNIPNAYRLVTDGKRVGVEFQCIAPKWSFARAISNEPERIEEFAHKYAMECKKLHATKCNTRNFPDVKDRFIKSVTDNKRLTEQQKAVITGFIKSVPEQQTCIHGDLHMGNIITNGKEDFWIDLADFSYGNPLFDLGCGYLQCFCLPEELCQKLYHVSKAQLQHFYTIFAKDYFETDNPQTHCKEIAPFAALYMIGYDNSAGMTPGMKEFIDEAFGFN